jgi:redox-sensitive bicupin YhaK (pirin superfamily)
LFTDSEQAALQVKPGRRIYVHVARGTITVNDTTLGTGDALKLSDTTTVTLKDGKEAEVIVFDLPGKR